MPLAKIDLRKKRDERYRGFERRRYERSCVDQVLKFTIPNPVFIKEFQIGKSVNISQSGLLFKTVTPPPRKAYILIDISPKMLVDLSFSTQNWIVIDHKIAAKVIRTHLNLENGLFEVGIRFIHPAEKHDDDFEAILKQH